MDSALDLIFAKEEETLEEFQENISTLSSREWVANDDGISIVHGKACLVFISIDFLLMLEFQDDSHDNQHCR